MSVVYRVSSFSCRAWTREDTQPSGVQQGGSGSAIREGGHVHWGL